MKNMVCSEKILVIIVGRVYITKYIKAQDHTKLEDMTSKQYLFINKIVLKISQFFYRHCIHMPSVSFLLVYKLVIGIT